MTQTLNKARLVDQLHRYAERCRMAYGIDKQATASEMKGKGEFMNRGYAEWRAYLEIAEDIENGLLGR